MKTESNMTFSTDCRLCPRLVDYLGTSKEKYPSYFSKPVPSFGAAQPALLIVGLAPGLHGANRTGRPFTGDYAGLLLYRTLHEFGFASAPTSDAADDGLQLIGCRITNAVRCVPPENKPTTEEVKYCNAYLTEELQALSSEAIVLALGSVAHGAVLRALNLRISDFRFGHAQTHLLPGNRILIDSYHCSRYNTQTRRLTETMFREVFASIRERLGGAAAA